MPDWVTYLLWTLSTLWAAATQTLYYVHMLQLNSYRASRFFKWVGDNPRRVWGVGRFLSLPAIAFAFIPAPWGGIAACLWLLLFGLGHRPQKAKKPLVFTARVKRLLVTVAILWLGLCATLWLLPLWAAATVLACSLALAWWPMLLALGVNTPVEKAIVAYYTRDAKKKLAAKSDMIVVGITGSYGKTSTKNFLHSLLSVKYNVLMTPENFNTPMGLVRTIREHLRPKHQLFLAEMGAKNVGDIKELCDLVHPTYGIITSIGEQHLETFGSVDNIVRTKFELADNLPQNGFVCLNFDNDLIRARAKAVTVPAVCYGVTDNANGGYRADNITVDAAGTHFTVTTPDGETQSFTTRLLGAHNVQNLAGCIALAHKLGVALGDMCYPVRMLRPVEHRLQLLPGGIIDDAYNSNPAGFKSALQVLKAFEGQRVLVTPGMVELGARQDALNRELGAAAADCCDYAVLVGERQAPPLKEGLLSAGFDESRIFVAATLQEGLAFVRGLPNEGARTVLLENDLPDNF